jgi:hypothetical protein
MLCSPDWSVASVSIPESFRDHTRIVDAAIMRNCLCHSFVELYDLLDVILLEILAKGYSAAEHAVVDVQIEDTHRINRGSGGKYDQYGNVKAYTREPKWQDQSEVFLATQQHNAHA